MTGKKMNEIYFDNSATTALSPAAREAMRDAADLFGNPSSLHFAGLRSAALLKKAREDVAASLGVPEGGELIFTASGTEANALAIFGTAYAKSRRSSDVILTTDSEHPSVARNLDRLEKDGFRVVRVPTRGGTLDMDTVRKYLNERLFGVYMMAVNNETGAIYPLREVFAAAHAAAPLCVCHADGVQAFLKIGETPASLGADLMSVSAHKIHGPKGVGALFIAPRLVRAKSIVPFYDGGGQEKGFRSGTENVIGIAGFAAAAREGNARFEASKAHLEALSARLIAELTARGLRVNLPPRRAPHIVNFTLPRIKSQTMLNFLSARGIAVSSGSACSSHKSAPSAALLAFGLSESEADTSLRVSFCAENTDDEVTAFLDALDAGLSTLIRIKR